MKAREDSKRSAPQLPAKTEAGLVAKRSHGDCANRRSAGELLPELQADQIEPEMQNEVRPRSEVAREESRDRYIDSYDLAPVGFLTLSDKGLIADINLTGAGMLGMDRAKLLQRRFIQYVAAADIDRWQRHFSDALREDTGLNCEVALLRPDGLRLDVRMDSLRVAKDGHPPAVRSVLTDITERKRAQEALSASVSFSSALVESMQEGLSLVDANGVHLEVNPALCRMTGFSREELIGSGVPHPYWPPEAEEAIRGAFRRAVEERASTLELTFMRKNGERFPVIVSPSMVKDAHGNILGYMATVKDITERKQVEEKLREIAMGLEQMVDQRTRELRTLSAQLTMTEERERRMLAEDLHDNLGQLLAVIKIKLSSLVAGSFDLSVNQIIGLVDQAEQSARSITLQLSPPILHTLGFVPALEWLAEEMDRVYGIAVGVDTEIGQKPFDDEMQTILYRSARELLINVAKHAKVERASLTCMCSDGRLVLVVSDDGRGFDPAAQGGVLSGQRSFGLDSIHERIVNIGGEMDIDSSPGNGTTVSLSVPCSIVTRGTCDDSHHAGR